MSVTAHERPAAGVSTERLGDMRTPGRPVEATVHPRTRPEAQEIAKKYRQENDWFRHDGKNTEPPPPGHVRLAGPYSNDIATKIKGDGEKWFAHNPSNPTDPRPASRCRTRESVQCKDKIYGNKEDWFKFDDNMNYHTPRPKNRMTSAQGKEVYEKMVKKDTNDWYHHDHGKNDTYTPPRPKTRSGKNHQAEDIGHRMRPHGTPDWYTTERKANDLQVVGNKPANRVHTADAGEYLERNKTGTAKDWFGHDPSRGGTQECGSPRILSPEAESNAVKHKGESENWFSHDANRNYSAAKKGIRGNGACAEMIEKSRGGQMEKALQPQASSEEPQRPAERIKPEAQDIAKKSIQGLMDKFMKQDENRGYQSDRPCGRTVKPEAEEIAKKNKGVMGDCMQGYAAPPMKKKPPGRAVKSEAAEIAHKNKGQMNNLMSNYGNLPRSAGRPGRTVLPGEASENALRNKGQMNKLMNDYGQLQLTGRQVQRLGSESAKINAVKGKGTVGGLLSMQA